jgi:hypothetical protein
MSKSKVSVKKPSKKKTKQAEPVAAVNVQPLLSTEATVADTNINEAPATAVNVPPLLCTKATTDTNINEAPAAAPATAPATDASTTMKNASKPGKPL